MRAVSLALALSDPQGQTRRGRCTGRSLGVGGSRPLGSRGKPSKLRRSVGSWRVGIDRRSSSWRWTIGPSSASPGSRPPGAWMHWNGPGWSPSADARPVSGRDHPGCYRGEMLDVGEADDAADSFPNPDDHDRDCGGRRVDVPLTRIVLSGDPSVFFATLAWTIVGVCSLGVRLCAFYWPWRSGSGSSWTRCDSFARGQLLRTINPIRAQSRPEAGRPRECRLSGTSKRAVQVRGVASQTPSAFVDAYFDRRLRWRLLRLLGWRCDDTCLLCG